MSFFSVLSWLTYTKLGRILLLSIAGLIGYLGFSQYYKHEGRKQVYERIERDTVKAKENRDEINERTRTTPDSDLDKWLRDRGSDE